MSFFDDPWTDPTDRDAFSLNFVPPSTVAAVAAEGLALRARFGRGGTAVGIARAEGLAGRSPLQAAEMRVIAGWFARHSKVRRATGWADPEKPSAGWIAWQLWGGDAGRAWVEAERGRWLPLCTG
ncbi:hypothetical protein RM190_10230 [Paracoccus sp. CPCC 101403]|uniref:Uncharacterized protein n=2 Tax=Paracoccus broussonetiae TaxID=3075834 RepID=A0ABU3EDC1_9RHOB|nr:hypothetical protein [Paracoccus sp. CPCC 101403]MDT1062237.1 hypothetical protein [Paracoccus sp. CPCC 101403]